MKNCLIPSTLSSSVFKLISFAWGANLAAKVRTDPANVAEKSTIWACLANLLMRLQPELARIGRGGKPTF